MRKGFSYLWVLVITLTTLTVISSVAAITARELQRQKLDREKLQAFAYAESGITYYKELRPNLPFALTLTHGRFEITTKQGIIYSTGYCRRGKQTIQLKGNQQTLCFD